MLANCVLVRNAMWKEFHFQVNGRWVEIWEEVLYECNICLEPKCGSELATPAHNQKRHLGQWQNWMKICKDCLKNIISFESDLSIDETNIFF